MSLPINIRSKRIALEDSYSSTSDALSVSKSPKSPGSDTDDRILHAIRDLNIKDSKDADTEGFSPSSISPVVPALIPLKLQNIPPQTGTSLKGMSPKRSPLSIKTLVDAGSLPVKSSSKKSDAAAAEVTDVQVKPNPLYLRKIVDAAIESMKYPSKSKVASIVKALDDQINLKNPTSAISDLWRISDKFCLIDAGQSPEKVLMEIDPEVYNEKMISTSERNKRFLTIFRAFNKRYGWKTKKVPRTPTWENPDHVKDWFENSRIQRKLSEDMIRHIRSFGQERYTGESLSILLLNEYGMVNAKLNGIFAKCVVAKAQFTRKFLSGNYSKESIRVPIEFIGTEDRDVKRSIILELKINYTPEGKCHYFKSKVLPAYTASK